MPGGKGDKDEKNGQEGQIIYCSLLQETFLIKAGEELIKEN